LFHQGLLTAELIRPEEARRLVIGLVEGPVATQPVTKEGEHKRWDTATNEPNADSRHLPARYYSLFLLSIMWMAWEGGSNGIG
jgi:hypothetical protein